MVSADLSIDSSATGTSSGQPDLWCTYAAVRTLAWLGRPDGFVHAERTARYLSSRRNGDGGYAWSRGMASDAWATYYCTQGLADLRRFGVDGAAPSGVERTTRWLRTTWSGDAFAMLPGQAPDVWATFFSTRTAVETCADGDAIDGERLLKWLSGLQTADGGLAWSPEHAVRGEADARACFYGVLAWRALTRTAGHPAPWDTDRLVGWLRAQQTPGGGFRFSPDAEVPCMWATYRATVALDALGTGPADPGACVAWIERMRGGTGAFVRWEGYPVEDVWASFCAIGSLRALRAPTGAHADPVVARMRQLACADGGYTYREPALAADALSTSATLLSDLARGADPAGPGVETRRRWLRTCLLPNEGGVMYMPARGSEVRCTLWALEAGALHGAEHLAERIVPWLRGLQNPDGGFGYWEGRGSDVVSTVAAAEIGRLLGDRHGSPLEPAALLRFLESCRAPGARWRAGNVPAGEPALRPTLQALRARHLLGDADPVAVAAALERHRVPGGGYANTGNRVPDLLSTYEAVLTASRHGIGVDREHVRRFCDRVTQEGGTAWTPLAPADGRDLLAECVGDLLRRRVADDHAALPALTIS
ncbi:prenyltransferase/squalene oxidase repeat-containing protein [Streptomyces sp. NPDC000134]|uniref:prenyltransferase/squalene oxidase repeat-containing protein n=1 Tax=Streptomyces sp. NPDC000134 TaxID=3364536 RepID=UPI003677B9AA